MSGAVPIRTTASGIPVGSTRIRQSCFQAHLDDLSTRIHGVDQGDWCNANLSWGRQSLSIYPRYAAWHHAVLPGLKGPLGGLA